MRIYTIYQIPYGIWLARLSTAVGIGATNGRHPMSGKTKTRDAAELLATVPYLSEMVRRIVERFDPLQIILFGSYARGDTRRDSDVDLLVVLDEVRDKRRASVDALSALSHLPFPVDVIVTDPEEIARRRNSYGSVLYPALQEGQVVYERQLVAWLSAGPRPRLAWVSTAHRRRGRSGSAPRSGLRLVCHAPRSVPPR